jgi:CRP/FNR family transcriptional regulator, cyclic AMP receptor protein
MDVPAARHTPVSSPSRRKPEPKRSKVNASVPADLIDRFEQATNIAGVGVAASLEDALTQWIERNITAESSGNDSRP